MEFDYGNKKSNGQYENYPSLSNEERQKGFVRPVRRSYKHIKCGTITTMGISIAETYAARPTYYGSTFCVGCHDHFPVGANGEFVWMRERTEDSTTRDTDEKVGT